MRNISSRSGHQRRSRRNQLRTNWVWSQDATYGVRTPPGPPGAIPGSGARVSGLDGAGGRNRTGTRRWASTDFKSDASTSFATPARSEPVAGAWTERPPVLQKPDHRRTHWRRRPDSNRCSRICSPLPYHLATPPVTTTGACADRPCPSHSGAGNGARTRDIHLGKVALYH